MSKNLFRCAIYTRKSTEEGLDQAFNSLDAQREACAAYVKSQASLGWKLIARPYDDGGLSGGTMERPALQDLLEDIKAGRVDVVIVYKIDRLTRSLMDFARMVEVFDRHEVSFVSITQQFNTTTSMGRLTLNVLLSFAQFEREVTSERIRDKIAASKKKGMWMGGPVPMGYRVEQKRLVIEPTEADLVRQLFDLYLEIGSAPRLKERVDELGLTTTRRQARNGQSGGKRFSLGIFIGYSPIPSTPAMFIIKERPGPVSMSPSSRANPGTRCRRSCKTIRSQQRQGPVARVC
jgi:site-specific DNA recombinase